MPKLLEIGPIRLAVLAADRRTKLYTLMLPPPNSKGGLKLTWDMTGVFDYQFEDGGQGTRAIDRPYIPKLTLTWSPYLDAADIVDTGTGIYPVGDGHLQRPTWEQLVAVTSKPYWNRLRVSPGPSAGGFTASKVTDKEYSLVHGTDFAEQVELTFFGTAGYSTKTLEEF